MKYFLSSVIILSSFALFLIPTHAEEERPSEETPAIETKGEDANKGGALIDKEGRVTNREEFRTNVQNRLTAIHVRAEERRANRKTRVPQEVQERIELSLDRTMTQFENAIHRLSSIADRIEDRIIRMHEQGFDVTQSLEALDGARVEVALSAEAVDGIARSIDETLSSDTPRSTRATLRAALEEARTSLKNARGALLKAIVIGRSEDTNTESVDEQEENVQ